jgi:hypothetical protein
MYSNRSARALSGLNAQGRFGGHDFCYQADDDASICPAGRTLSFVAHKRQTDGINLRRYATKGRLDCALKARCTTSAQRVITRWEHEEVLEAVQRRLDENPHAMRPRRETVEHPFATIKMRMGATHFLMKRLKNVKTEMALSLLACNLTRLMNIIGITPLLAAIRA